MSDIFVSKISIPDGYNSVVLMPWVFGEYLTFQQVENPLMTSLLCTLFHLRICRNFNDH